MKNSFIFSTAVIFIFHFFSCNYIVLHSPLGFMASGSYANAQSWRIGSPENEVITAAKYLKNENLEMLPPHFINENGKEDSLVDSLDTYWYHIYFFDKEEGNIYYSWVWDPYLTNGKTQISFTGIAKYDMKTKTIGTYREINNDFKLKENQRIIKRFKELFLLPLKKKLKMKS